jgi:capsule polysaccharide export protein KpsE/RkpR
MMITKKITSIVFIIAFATMFVSSSVFVNSILAKTSTSISKGSTSTASSGNGNMATAQQDYTNFQKCLSSAEGTKGFATQLEIKNCYYPVYHILTTNGTSTTGTSTTGTKIGK